MKDKETNGTTIAASNQWWLKVNRKPIRLHALDGAEFPYIIKVQYCVNGKPYYKRKGIDAGKPLPSVGSSVQVHYDSNRPFISKIVL